jgi:hypothetical protein
MFDERFQDLLRKKHQIELISRIREHAMGVAYVARLPSGAQCVLW